MPVAEIGEAENSFFHWGNGELKSVYKGRDLQPIIDSRIPKIPHMDFVEQESSKTSSGSPCESKHFHSIISDAIFLEGVVKSFKESRWYTKFTPRHRDLVQSILNLQVKGDYSIEDLFTSKAAHPDFKTTVVWKSCISSPPFDIGLGKQEFQTA